MNTFKPVLSTGQVTHLKADIKRISNTLLRHANCKPFGIATTQNQFAKILGYTSFSELSLLSQRQYKAADKIAFSIIEELTKQDLMIVYGYNHTNHYDTVLSVLKSALESDKPLLECVIDADVIKSGFDEGEINGGVLNLATGLPKSFKVHQNHASFINLNVGDMFKVKHQGDETWFTVVDSACQMDTGKPSYQIDCGRVVMLDSGARFSM